MKLRPNELLIYYNNKYSSHRKTRALAYSVADHVQERDFEHYKLTKLMWEELLELLQMNAKQLLNKADARYQTSIAHHDFDDNDWLEILVKNPDMIRAPIAIMDNQAILCERPKDVFRLSEHKKTLDTY